jgi:hypothetical protein
MRFREQHHDATEVRENLPAAAPAGGNLAQVREAGHSLFEAADEAIRRALSGNSRTFLEATRQEGGQ